VLLIMPRDDLSIDMVKNNIMPPLAEAPDPATILDEWINRTSNMPEEIRFIQDEIADKDRQYTELLKIIEERDGRIQKWIKANGSHEPNPKEEGYRKTIRESYDKADQLAADKITLGERLKVMTDKHIRQLDIQIKMLFDRNEPGFTDPDDLPSLLRPSAANAVPTTRPLNPTASALQSAPVPSTATPVTVKPTLPHIRTTHISATQSASAPATPAASIILSRQVRESSAGPATGAPKRGPRVNSGLANAPATSSGLARHSSLGPGTPKGLTVVPGVQRAGSAGPRATTKTTGPGPGRKAGTPTGGVGRKKATPSLAANKSNLSRVKRPSKASPSASAAESELSDAETGSESDASSAAATRRGTPVRATQQPSGDGAPGTGGPPHAHHPPHHALTKRAHDDMDADDDEAGDDKKYCLCQNVSHGDMIACDNDDCPFEWFHWACVGMKSEPKGGSWFCPVCRDKTDDVKKSGK
jgi:inhibitor of growth protein 3